MSIDPTVYPSPFGRRPSAWLALNMVHPLTLSGVVDSIVAWAWVVECLTGAWPRCSWRFALRADGRERGVREFQNPGVAWIRCCGRGPHVGVPETAQVESLLRNRQGSILEFQFSGDY